MHALARAALRALLAAGLLLAASACTLANTGLVTVPTSMGPYAACTSLDLSGNWIVRLPAGAFTGLTALTALHLQDNAIAVVEAGAFTGLPALQVGGAGTRTGGAHGR